MKFKQFNRTSIIFAIIANVFLFASSSCTKKLNFSNSAVVPAAEGFVKVKKDKNDNYALSINVNNLASPSQLQPAHNAYVAWIETDSHGTKNIGQLKTSSSIISKAKKASLNAVTSFKPVKIFITAEDNSNTQYPGSMIVLSTDNF